MKYNERELLKSTEKNINKIRSFLIENTSILLDNSKNDFNIFCCALDNIEDTFLAIKFFCENGLGEHTGEKYLKLWGLLQAIVMQQDAIRELYKLAKIDFQFLSSFNTVRDIRINIAGHPTTAKYGKLLCSVSRSSLNNNTIDTILYDKREKIDDCVSIEYKALVFEYLEDFNGCLEDLLKLNLNCV